MIETRLANKFDVDYFIKMVNLVQKLEHNFDLPITPLSNTHLSKVFTQIIAGAGVCVIVHDGNKNIGLAAGIISPNIWSPETYILNQILLFVDEEYRNTRAGYKLIKEYNDISQDMIEQHRIHYAILTASEPMFEMDFSRFGYELKEKLWVLGE